MLILADKINEEKARQEVAKEKAEAELYTNEEYILKSDLENKEAWNIEEKQDIGEPIEDPITTLDMGYVDLKTSKKYLNAVNKAKKLSKEELIKEASKDRAINSAYREELCNRLLEKDRIKDKMKLSELTPKKLFEESEPGKTYRFMYNPSNNELEKYGFYRALTYDSRTNVDGSRSPEEFTEMFHKDIDKVFDKLSKNGKYKDLIDSGKIRINIRFTQGVKQPMEYGGEFNRDDYSIEVVEYSDKPFDDDLDNNKYYVDMQLNKKFNKENPDYRNGLYKDKIPVDNETVYSCMKERRYFKDALDYYRKEEEKGNVVYLDDREAPLTRKTFLLKNKVDLKLNSNDKNICRVKKVLFDQSYRTSPNSQVFDPFYECDVEATADLYAEKDSRLTPDFIKRNVEEMYLDPSGNSGYIVLKNNSPEVTDMKEKYHALERFGDRNINDKNQSLAWELAPKNRK